MYGNAMRIAGNSKRWIIAASTQSEELPTLEDGTSFPKLVAVTIYGADEAFFSFTAGAVAVTLQTGHHQSQEDGMQVYWVVGNTHFNLIGLATDGSVFCITPLDT